MPETASGLPPAERVETDVGAILMPAGDQLMRVGMARDRVWEPNEGALFREIVSPGMTVLDVGAHCGYFTLMLAGLVGGEGEVVAIEPEPGNHALLRANLEQAGAGNVRVVNAAAWRSSGENLPLSLSDSNTGDHRSYRWGSGRAFIEVPSIAVDDLDPPLDRLDVVKLDTQATEHVVIDGMRATIDRFRPLMLVEFWPTGIRELGDTPEDVVGLYRELDYEISVIDLPGRPAGLPAAELISRADAFTTEYFNLLLTPRSP
ncbi:MAG TPA: FkbM family methyltransferase [Solirubrobacterales bacterium]|nr:FkbM family methyltransferase [Solirubrobacterales bacterium]